MKKLTTKEFIEKARIVHGNKYDYSKVEYTDSKTYVTIICPIHGEFETKPNTHLNGKGCKKCSHRSFKYVTEEFIKKAKLVHGDKYDYSKVDYVNNKTKICVICPIHGGFWQTPSSHLSGRGCKQCKGDKIREKKRKDTETFINESKKNHDNKYNYSKVEYVNAHTKVCIICPKHGEFWQTPDDHLNGKGCGKCKMSKLEKMTMDTLGKHGFEFVYQCNKGIFSWLDKQHLDFYLPQYNVAIECQGEQHFIPSSFGSKDKDPDEYLGKIQERDERKRKLCEEHGIKLLYFSNKKYTDEIITDEKNLLEEIKKRNFLNK